MPRSKSKILLVDDSMLYAADFEKLFGRAYEITHTTGLEELERNFRPGVFDVVVLDMVLDGVSGLDGLRLVKKRDPHCPVLLISDKKTSVEDAVRGIKMGADYYLLKTDHADYISQVIEKEVRSAIDGRQYAERLLHEWENLSPPIAESAAMKGVLDHIRPLTAERETQMPLLLWGSPGTGREHVARWLHKETPSEVPGEFRAILCEWLTGEDLEREIFGGDGGDGKRPRRGALELGTGSVAYIAGASCVPLDLQSKLLDAIDRGWYRRRDGSSGEVTSRVVLSLTEDPGSALQQGRFHQQLYNRLRAGAIRIPPLAERPEDVRTFIERELKHMSPRPELTDPARGKLLRHSWPGGFDELRYVLNLAACRAVDEDGAIDSELVEAMLPVSSSPGNPTSYAGQKDVWHRQVVRDALARSDWIVAEAAALLEVDRKTVHKWINKDPELKKDLDRHHRR